MSNERAAETRKSLERVQQFDVATLPREAELGHAFSFKDAVIPASKAISLFRKLPLDFLDELPDTQLKQLKSAADAFYGNLGTVLSFDSKQENPVAAHANILRTISSQHQDIFNQLHAQISYLASRQYDIGSLERDFHAAIQDAKDRAEQLHTDLAGERTEAQRILADIRKVAAEQGVSQQAHYFASESDSHHTDAATWRNSTIASAGVLVAYATLSAFAHKLPWLTPTSTYETIQLAISKILIFIVLAYVLLLSARNFLAHKHNAIVNKHRQNALLTFKALTDAAGAEHNRDIVLTHAAACIFSPQDTAYGKSNAASTPDVPLNIIQALPKLSGTSAAT